MSERPRSYRAEKWFTYATFVAMLIFEATLLYWVFKFMASIAASW